MTRTGRDEACAFAPATVGNAICGFDVLGFAIERPGDVVRARRREEPGVALVSVEGDGGALPRDAGKNTAGVAVACLLEARGVSTTDGAGVELELEKGMPLASGLGSSAASAVAAVVAADALFDEPSAPDVLLRAAVEGERAACGAAHADNAAPALLGGFVLVRGGESLRADVLPVPEGFSCAVVHPRIEVSTGDARAVLPEFLPLETAVVQWGRVAALVAGLAGGDMDLIASALQDSVAEPFRKRLVPGYEKVRAAGLDAGALGCGLSGSGPSIVAICADRDAAGRAADAMAKALAGGPGLDGEPIVSAVGAPGARLLDEDDA